MDNPYLIIRNGTIITPSGLIPDGVVVVRGEKILETGRRGTVTEPAGATIVDAGGNFISPGFIDIHVNGANGADVSEIDEETYPVMSRFFPQYGTTAYVGTAITGPVEKMVRSLRYTREYLQEEHRGGAELLGIHLEGPYLSYEQRGAHPASHLALPEPGHYGVFLDYDDVLVRMTLAPELEGAARLTGALRERGILVSAGHTHGIWPAIREALDAGLNHATHFFCNMSGFRRDHLKRVAGVAETLLWDDRVGGDLIGDGWHVGPRLMQLLVKVKGVERVCLVTDAMPATGLPDGLHKIGEVEAVVENGIARLPDNSAYAGSVATMDICMKTALKEIEVSLPEAVRMCSLTPATTIGAGDRKGSLEKGKDADITIFDHQINILKTFCRGELVYSK